MELMDWKNIERSTEAQIRDAEVQIVINNLLLKEAVKEIKKLGGESNAEISAKVKVGVK